jgi:hypothetical protein
MAAAFGLAIKVTSPGFGADPLLDTIVGSPAVATLVGEQTTPAPRSPGAWAPAW